MSAELGVEVKSEKTATMAECKEESEPKVPGNEEEEDIPPDFFDDFSNRDFMEGLDIVDTWDDEMPEEGECAKDDSQNGEDGEKSEDGTSEVKKEGSKNAIKHTKERERELRMLKYKNYERSQRYKDLREKIGRPEEARRRDPEKTRRDILRDKDRCAKDKEVRIIKEKLKVVETGLVPPGMEMEVDLADIRSQQNSTKPKVEPRPIVKPKIRSRSRSYERYRFRERPLRSRSRSRSRERRRLRDDLSPRKRLRSRSRSSLYEKRYRSGERNVSPRRRTRDRSRSSELSDREKWLSRRYRRSPSPRQRSTSPDRKRLDYKKDVSRRSDPEPRETKPSFLEEIHRKLNETVPPATQIAVQQAIQLRTSYNAAAAAAAAAVVAVPPPVTIQTALPIPPALPAQLSFPSQVAPPVQYDQTVVQQQQQQQQYDQQFFIGTCDMPVVAPPVPQTVLYGQPTPVPPPGAVPTMPSLPLNHGMLPSTSLQSAPNTSGHRIEVNSLLPSAAKLAKDKRTLEETDKRALSKLLEDKKISLSDFLTITARPTASRTPNLQEKISVISRCQDAIKDLGGDVTSGRLFIKRYPKPETSESRQHASPLRKIPIVRLNYTSLVKPDGDVGFPTILKKLLQSVCVPRETEDARKTQQLPRTRQRTKKKQSKQQAAAVTQTVDATTPATHLTKMCQTEPYKCRKCQVRAARMFQDQMVQCEIKKYANASTQTVAEEPTPLKSKSLSHMTPAEILAEVEQNKETGLRIPKVEPNSDESDEEEKLDAAGILQNTERSVELDHSDKDILEPTQKPRAGDEKYTIWNRGGFSPRAGGRGGGSPFRGSRGFKSSRGRKPYYKGDLDIYGPNFDDDEEYVFNRSAPPDSQFRSFDDNYYNQSGPSNQRPFFEPPDNVKRKFNRRFL